jgi:hypothetical protein
VARCPRRFVLTVADLAGSPAARNFRIGERIFAPAGSFAFRERELNGLFDEQTLAAFKFRP